MSTAKAQRYVLERLSAGETTLLPIHLDAGTNGPMAVTDTERMPAARGRGARGPRCLLTADSGKDENDSGRLTRASPRSASVEANWYPCPLFAAVSASRRRYNSIRRARAFEYAPDNCFAPGNDATSRLAFPALSVGGHMMDRYQKIAVRDQDCAHWYEGRALTGLLNVSLAVKNVKSSQLIEEV